MYTDNKTIQIIISYLKEYGIRHAVLSPGSRNVPLVHSLEIDNFFKCYSIVDERSAAYFALGLSIEHKEPVLISCTSATASTNYSSAICEAFEQKIPLLVLTSDRNQYFLNQLEDQMIPQTKLYPGRTKAQISVPIIKDSLDEWYCRKIINEALIELEAKSGGPVHINIPTDWGLFAQNFNTIELPKVKPFKKVTLKDMFLHDIEEITTLKKKKRILIIYGQTRQTNPVLLKNIKEFTLKYNVAIATESISNLDTEISINTSLICKALNKEVFSKEYAPDLVISFNGNYISPIKGLLKGCTTDFEHWTINEEGKAVDQFKKLSRIFECSTADFFSYFNQKGGNSINDMVYFNFWKQKINSLPEPDFPYSDNYAMQEFMKNVPSKSIIHYGNGVSVHIAQYFPIDYKNVHYCHSGTTTIDGSLSTFIGQAAASKKPAFAFIGDLSFFYDMNAIWNRYVGKNVRILLYNNEGGQTFHWNNAKDIDTLQLHTSAEHFTTAKGWVESRGFKYYSAKNKEEFDKYLPEFLTSESDTPLFFEVFTKKETDARIILDYYEACKKALK